MSLPDCYSMRFTTLMNYHVVDWWCDVNFCFFTWWLDSRFYYSNLTRDTGGRKLSLTITLVLWANWLTKYSSHSIFTLPHKSEKCFKLKSFWAFQQTTNVTDGEFSWCSSSKNAIKLAICYCLHMWLLCVFFWILWKIKAKLIFSCYRFFLTFWSTSWRFSFFPHINWLAYPWDIDKMVHMCNSYHSYQSFIKSYWAKNLSCDQSLSGRWT